MRFKNFEKSQLLKLLRNADVVHELRKSELPEDISAFLTDQGLWQQIRDYAIIPLGIRTRKGKPENIVFTWYMNSDFDFHNLLENVCDILTPPFRILVDFSMIIQDKEQNLRFVWAQRNLNCNKTTNIKSQKCFNDLLAEFKIDRHALTRMVANNHMAQSLFDTSGYQPRCLLTAVIYLSKYETQPQ